MRIYTKIGVLCLCILCIGSMSIYGTGQKILLQLITEIGGETNVTYAQLREGYVNNNATIRDMLLQAEKAALSLETATIAQSPDISISSGSMTATLGTEDAVYTLSPNATVTIPSWNNLQVKATVPLSLTVQTDKEALTSLSGSGVSVSADIISSTKKTQTVRMIEAQRVYEQANQNVVRQYAVVEKQFLEELKTLVTLVSNTIKAENESYDAQLSLNTVTAQGYAQTSSSYRTAQLQVSSAQNTVSENRRIFQNALAQFSNRCGIALTTVPTDIPEIDLIDIRTFSAADYTALEDALWTQYIHTQERDAASDFTLSGSAGYGYQEKNSVQNTSVGTHALNTGLSAQYKGLTVNAGVSVPVPDISKPSFSLSIGWALNTGKIQAIETASADIDAQLEVSAIETAKHYYDDDVKERERIRSDLEWKRTVYAEQENLYADFLHDTEVWYAQGAVTESQYAQAQRNYVNAVITQMTAKIERLIYNIDVRLLFIIGE